MCVYKKPQSETGNKRLREPHKTRSAKRTSAAEQKREQRTHAAPKNSSSLSSLAAHPTSSPSYSRPVRCCPPQLANTLLKATKEKLTLLSTLRAHSKEEESSKDKPVN
jgi:hypothetical protein